MFIKLPDNITTVALNLNAFDTVEIHEDKDVFILAVSRKLSGKDTPEEHLTITLQTYQTYEDAFNDFQAMMDALSGDQRVWVSTPQ